MVGGGLSGIRRTHVHMAGSLVYLGHTYNTRSMKMKKTVNWRVIGAFGLGLFLLLALATL